MIRRRSLSRLRVALPLALAGLLVGGSSSGSDRQGLPLESTHNTEYCGDAARAVGPDQCDVEARASAESGVVSGRAHLVSPYHGRAPWTAEAGASPDVVATYQLTESTPDLDFEVRVHVDRGRVALAESGLPSRWWGELLDSQLGRAARIDVDAMALHSKRSDCGGATGELVLSSWRPGTDATISGEDVVLDLNVHCKDGVLPPGEITIRTGASASVWQTNGWGDDSASVDAVVQKIALLR